MVFLYHTPKTGGKLFFGSIHPPPKKKTKTHPAIPPVIPKLPRGLTFCWFFCCSVCSVGGCSSFFRLAGLFNSWGKSWGTRGTSIFRCVFGGRKWPTRFFNAGCLVSSDAGCRLLVHFVDLYWLATAKKWRRVRGHDKPIYIWELTAIDPFQVVYQQESLGILKSQLQQA